MSDSRTQTTACCGGGDSKPARSTTCGCGGASAPETPGPAASSENKIHATDSHLAWRNRWDHILARWSFDREGHRVAPGLYSLGSPTPDSPVLVTANYSLSFDAVRTALPGRSAYILVLETFGVNVWCAAGKGTFGTDELIRRIQTVELGSVVRHHRVSLPQLGAPGVDAAAVRQATGFRAEFGPVRANDLPAYLESGKVTSEMRRVQFRLWDRMVLIPVEVMAVIVPLLILALLRLGDFLAAGLAGLVLFPILFPFLPTPNFSTKGYLLGALTAAPFALVSLGGSLGTASLGSIGMATAQMLVLPPITAFAALNFTGSTPYPSRTGVKREMGRYIRPMAIFFAIGLILYIAMVVLRLVGAAQ
jgi:hypothetical protein